MTSLNPKLARLFDTHGYTFEQHVSINGLYIKSMFRNDRRLLLYIFTRHGDYTIIVDRLDQPVLYFDSSCDAWLPSGQRYGSLRDLYNGKMLFQRHDGVQVEYLIRNKAEPYFDIELEIAGSVQPINPFMFDLESGKKLLAEDVHKAISEANRVTWFQMFEARLAKFKSDVEKQTKYRFGILNKTSITELMKTEILSATLFEELLLMLEYIKGFNTAMPNHRTVIELNK